MSYKNIPQIENALRNLYRVGITTNEQLMQLSMKDLQTIRGFGVMKVNAIQQLQHLHLEDDVFKMFKNDTIQPKRLRSFFTSLNINYENVLKTKLHNLYKTTRMTPGRKRAFLEFKYECLRAKYNNTIESEVPQSSDDIVQELTTSYFKSFKKYLSESSYEILVTEAKSVILDVNLQNVDLHTYGDEINNYLDYEFFFSNLNDHFLEDMIYQIIYQHRKEIKMFALKQKIKSISLFQHADITAFLSNLLKNGFAVYTSHGIKYNKPKVTDYIQNTPEQYEIMKERLRGKTLEEIGQVKGVTRERIRQLEKMEAKTIPFERLFEFKYVDFYNHYDLSEQEFQQVFNFSEQQYLYLKLYTSSNELGEKWSKEDLLESQMLNLKEQEVLLNIINKDYIIIGSQKIKKNKLSIASYCVEQFAKNTIKIADLHKHVVDFCEDYKLDFEFDSVRAFEGVLYRVEASLWKYGKRIRYYNIEKDLIISTISNINFNRYNDQEISVKKILNDYYDEMAEIDIKDEYELHNLFKKYQEFLPDTIKLRRMPLMEIGDSNREEQLIDLLIEFSPISKDDFALQYSERYGVLIQTVKTNFVPLLNEFADGDILNADAPIVPIEVINQLKEILTDDFYFKEDIYKEYSERFGKGRLSDYIFNLVGYRNFTEFILKENYTRADHYFETTYFNKELFEITDKRLMYLGSFRKKLIELMENLDVFEYDKNNFIRFKKIQSTGITKEDIVHLINTIIDEVGDRYFTVDNVEPIIEDSVLNQLGFDNIFYESVLKAHKSLRYQYMGNKVIFRRTKEKFYIHNLVEETVSRFKKIDIYDLITYLDDTYYIFLTKEKIIQCTEMTNLYYHPVMEMIYQDIDEFYDMMEAN